MRLTVKEMAVFGMLAGLMFASKQIMEVLPNVHLLGVFTIAITLVYRRKALYPIYGFVLIQGLFSGFALWWIPYLYLWTVLWGAAMLLLPRVPVRYPLCPRPGPSLRAGLEGDGHLDPGRPALGLCPRHQQLLLWAADPSPG